MSRQPLLEPAPTHALGAARPHRGHQDRRGFQRSCVGGLLGVLGAGTGLFTPARAQTAETVARRPIDDRQAALLDRHQAPAQFALDLGRFEDEGLQTYVGEVAAQLQAQLARKDLVVRVQVLRAHHLNAYAFPAGAIGLTRGLLLELDNEAELAALLALQLAHVDLRQASLNPGARNVQQAIVTQAVAASQEAAWAPTLGLGGKLGASALLADYGPAQARDADTQALRLLVAAGYPASALPAALERLLARRRAAPELLAAFELAEPELGTRITAQRHDVEVLHAASRDRPDRRAAFQQRCAALIALRPLLAACQAGERELLRRNGAAAQAEFTTALTAQPRDAAALLRMSQALQMQGKLREARGYAESAREVDPDAALALKQVAALALAHRDPLHAWQALEAHDKLLPGDPAVVFLKGLALEGLGQAGRAAEHYRAYLGYTGQGQAAVQARTRLRLLGHAAP